MFQGSFLKKKKNRGSKKAKKEMERTISLWSRRCVGEHLKAFLTVLSKR
jgi:hypothetical protein